MNNIYSVALTIWMSMELLLPFNCLAQLDLSLSPYTQNFDSIGMELPKGWTIRTGATASELGTIVAFSTAPTPWSGTSGNFKNFASAEGLNATAPSAEQSAAANRALGIRQTGTFGDPGCAYVLHLSNTLGLTDCSISFRLQSLSASSSGRTTIWHVDYGLGPAPAAFYDVATDPALLRVEGWAVETVNAAFGSALDNRPDDVWIRILTTVPSVGSGSRPPTAIDDFQLNFLEGDFTPPAFTPTWPRVTNLNEAGFDLSVSMDEAGKAYYAILLDDAPMPTSTQVRSGQDAEGSLLPIGFFGVIDIPAPAEPKLLTITSLNFSTDYAVCLVLEDLRANLLPFPLIKKVRTLPSTDVIPPDFYPSYPTIENILPTGLTINSRLNEKGSTYYVIVPSGDVPPSALQVRNGWDGHDMAVEENRIGVMAIANTDTDYSSVVTGLTANTQYDIYLVAEDIAVNLQMQPTKITLTTGSMFSENFNTCSMNNSFVRFSRSGDQAWSCTDSGRTLKGMRINGFSGGPFPNEDWLISPLVRLSRNASLSFYSQFSFDGAPLKLKISLNYSGAGDPGTAVWSDLDGGFPVLAVASTSTALSDWTFSKIDLSAFADQAVYLAFVYTSTNLSAARWTIDDVTFTNGTASYILASPSVLTLKAGGTSGSYTVRGVNLSEKLMISAPDNFEISKDNVNFSRSLSFTETEVATEKTVFARFAPSNASVNTQIDIISNVSGNFATKGISVRGFDSRQTFDAVTFNLNFFGTDITNINGTEFGPTNDALQIGNVATVLRTLAADLIAVEEVADDNAFGGLMAALPGYGKILSNRWSYSFDPPDPYYPSQKIGIIYDTATVSVINTRVMFEELYDGIQAGVITLPSYPGGNSSKFWSSGRLPFMVLIGVTINGVYQTIRVIVVHAKSGPAAIDHDRRSYDIKVLHDSIAAHYPNDRFMVLGDFNDDVDTSITPGSGSSCQVFVMDSTVFDVLTYEASMSGVTSFPSSGSLLDHLMVSKGLGKFYVKNSVYVEDARNYVPGYLNNTSDHLPVVARFLLAKEDQTISFQQPPIQQFGNPPYALSAVASSGQQVDFISSDTAVVSINGNKATIRRAGVADITAFQDGNGSFLEAQPVIRTMVINRADQKISFQVPSDKTVGDPAFPLNAIASSGLPVTFTSTSDKIDLNAKLVTLLEPGRVTVKAMQPGDMNYYEADPVDISFCIKPVRPTLTIANDTETIALISNASGECQWLFDGSIIEGAVDNMLVVNTPGVYSVRSIRDDCLSDWSAEEVVIITGGLVNLNDRIAAFPNPVDNQINITGLDGASSMGILVDMKGIETPMALYKAETHFAGSTEHLDPGLYLLWLGDKNGIHVIRFLKR